MNRIIKIPNAYGTEDKYVLRDEYNGFGFYQEKCPTGYFVNQSYLIANEKIKIICESYNNMCKEELLDAIDNYTNTGKFELKVFSYGVGFYRIHPSGKVNI